MYLASCRKQCDGDLQWSHTHGEAYPDGRDWVGVIRLLPGVWLLECEYSREHRGINTNGRRNLVLPAAAFDWAAAQSTGIDTRAASDTQGALIPLLVHQGSTARTDGRCLGGAPPVTSQSRAVGSIF
jgi:hypothetical protein